MPWAWKNTCSRTWHLRSYREGYFVSPSFCFVLFCFSPPLLLFLCLVVVLLFASPVVVPCRVVRFSMMFCFRPENPSFRTSISLNEADDEGQRLDAFAAAQVRCRTNGKTVWNHKNDTSSGDPTRMVAFRVLFFTLGSSKNKKKKERENSPRFLSSPFFCHTKGTCWREERAARETKPKYHTTLSSEAPTSGKAWLSLIYFLSFSPPRTFSPLPLVLQLKHDFTLERLLVAAATYRCV